MHFFVTTIFVMQQKSYFRDHNHYTIYVFRNGSCHFCQYQKKSYICYHEIPVIPIRY